MTKGSANGDNFEPLNPFRKSVVCYEHAKWLADPDLSHAITLNANRSVSLPKMLDLCVAFSCEVDRYKHQRRNVRSIPSIDRVHAIGVAEHLDSNLHLHFAVRLDGWLEKPFSQPDHAVFEHYWRKISKSGSIWISKNYAPFGWEKYMMKEHYRRDGDIILSRDFHPN